MRAFRDTAAAGRGAAAAAATAMRATAAIPTFGGRAGRPVRPGGFPGGVFLGASLAELNDIRNRIHTLTRGGGENSVAGAPRKMKEIEGPPQVCLAAQ